jgi:hypothetical protein
MVGKWIAWTAIAVPLNAPLSDEAAAGRIDPLLIARAPKEMPGKLRFGLARLACHKQLNIVGYRHFTIIYDDGGECDRRVQGWAIGVAAWGRYCSSQRR